MRHDLFMCLRAVDVAIAIHRRPRASVAAGPTVEAGMVRVIDHEGGHAWLYIDGVPVREMGESEPSLFPFADFCADLMACAAAAAAFWADISAPFALV